MKRFWDKVLKTNSCWIWASHISGNGYGYFSLNNKELRAHRVAYELTKGPIPKGLHVMHTCDNPKCVNPDHLKIGTHQDNMSDMVKKGRHHSGRTKYSDFTVYLVRMMFATCQWNQREIAQEIGMSAPHVKEIVRNQSRTKKVSLW